MKQTRLTPIRLAGAAVLALAVVAIPALVIVGIGSHAAFAGDGDGMAARHGGNHAEHFARMAAALGLTDQQKAAARKLHEEAAAKAGPIKEQARLQHEEIEAMLESGSPDPAELGQRMIAMYATHKQLKALHEQTMTKLTAQLTAEQRAKFEKLHTEHAGAPGEHGRCMGAFGDD